MFLKTSFWGVPIFGQVKFVTHDGELMTDEGLSWNEVIDGTPRTGTVTYEESWMSCPTVVQMETTDSNHPCGGGHPVPPWDTSFGVWNVSTTSKRVLMLKNHNCTFEQDMGPNKEAAQVIISNLPQPRPGPSPRITSRAVSSGHRVRSQSCFSPCR